MIAYGTPSNQRVTTMMHESRDALAWICATSNGQDLLHYFSVTPVERQPHRMCRFQLVERNIETGALTGSHQSFVFYGSAQCPPPSIETYTEVSDVPEATYIEIEKKIGPLSSPRRLLAALRTKHLDVTRAAVFMSLLRSSRSDDLRLARVEKKANGKDLAQRYLVYVRGQKSAQSGWFVLSVVLAANQIEIVDLTYANY